MTSNHLKIGAVSLLATTMTFGGAAMAQSTTPGDKAAAPEDNPVAPEEAPAAPVYETGPGVPAERAAVAVDSPTTPPERVAVVPVAPRGDVVEHTWPNRPLLTTGIVVLGATYGASVIVGAASSRDTDHKLYVPVVGPWLDLKDRNCPCDHETLNKTLLIGSGVLQGIGALDIVLGLIVPEAKEKPWYLIGDEKLSVTPQVGTNQTGLTAFGHF